MLALDQAIADFDSLLDWLEVDDRQRHYTWSPAEDRELRQWWGKIPRKELADRITVILRRITGDHKAERSINAIACRAAALDLEMYNGEPGEMCLAAAAKWGEVPFEALWRAMRNGDLPTEKRGKQRYVSEQNLSAWLVAYRDRQEAQGEILNGLEGLDVISKQEAMALAGLSETHITRYLQTGVIKAWKLPDLSCGTRGDWLVLRDSVEAFAQARAEGRLQELLDSQPDYVALRHKITQEIGEIRRAGRVAQRDPLTQPKSRYHPGCFTVVQVASHVGLSSQVIYEAIRNGQVEAREVISHGRPRYAIAPEEARRYATWVAQRGQAAKRWHDRRRRLITEAGLLTVKDLAERWQVSVSSVYDYVRYGLHGHTLRSRTWGRYRVFVVEDVEEFERVALLASPPSLRSPRPGGEAKIEPE